MRILFILLISGFILGSSGHIYAQDTAPEAEQQVESTQYTDFEQRLELSRALHKIKPVKDQVDDAVNGVAERLPVSQRETFKASMRNILNYNSIENISINAMAETFTLKELEVMLEYNSKPEAMSANDKFPEYQNIVGPEILRMIDKAIMRSRTGVDQ